MSEPKRTFTQKHLHTEGKPKKIKKPKTATEQPVGTSSFKRKTLKNNFSAINKKLAAIYKEDDGSMPDMHHFTKGRGHRWKRLLLGTAAVLLVFSAAAWAGFFLFGNQGPSFTEDSLSINISAPESIIAGEIITYRIRIANKQPLQLAQTELTLHYPEGFVFEESSLLPIDDIKNKWKFGSIDGFEDVVLEVTGSIIGAVDSQQSLRAFLSYKPSNFNSDFQTIETFTHTFDGTPVTLDATVPESATPGDIIPLSFVVTNITKETIGPIELRLDGGEDFSFSEAKNTEELPDNTTQPEPNVWLIESLDAEQELTIEHDGAFTSDAQGEQSITSSIALIHDGSPYTQAEEKKRITTTANSLALSLIANGSRTSLLVAPEDALTFSLFYNNTGQQEIKNLTVSVLLDVPSVGAKAVLSPSSLDAASTPKTDESTVNPDTKRITLTWNKKQISALGTVNAGEEGAVPFSMYLRSQSEIDYSKLAQFRITATAEGEFENGTTVSVQTAPLTIDIGSDTTLDTTLEPIDPSTLDVTSDATNTYRVTWKTTNSLHTLTSVTTKANLAGSITWLGEQASIGSVSYNEKSKSITWTIPQLDTSDNEQSASFIFTLHKAAGQTELMSQTTLQGLDTTISQNILRSSSPLSFP